MNGSSQGVTVVTGGSRGIGAAVALRLARNGHDIALGYLRDKVAAEKVVRSIEQAGVRCIAVQADTSTEEGATALFSAAQAKLGAITGLVNNAGITGPIGPFMDTPLEAVHQVIEVNVFGLILCSQLAARSMAISRGGGGGAIVNISSAAATLGSPGEYVHYAASKGAVDAFTVGLAKELALEGVRVNAVSPGIVNTEIHARAGEPDRIARVAKRVPFGRAGEPEEIAGAVAWLFSSEASYTSGAILRVAGGS